jgi:16S rRNA A1518/A1519 N6-dimethyltransferase RsmA/KsgA/DIM1 with predicted DNA glycosylase/AP lyase activity
MRLENQTLTPVEPGSTESAGITIDTLVHLGAGQCSELDSYLALKAGKIVLVEADPQIAAALQARTASLPNVRVMCNAVAGSAGPAVFIVTTCRGQAAFALQPACCNSFQG